MPGKEEKMAEKSPYLKTAIVTGACSGMGLALVRHLLARPASDGELWRVVLADINEPRYLLLKPSLPTERHIFVRTDVSSWAQQVELFDQAFEWSQGRIDFFANNAGIADPIPLLGWLGSTKEAARDQVPQEPNLSCIDVDLKAVFYGLQLFVHHTRRTRRAAPHTQHSGNGAENGISTFHPKMVITASMAGIYPFFILPVYTAAKHGCVGLVRAAAPTLLENEGITLNCIMPGTVKTEIIPKAVLAQWPNQYITPYETIMRAFDELIDVHGYVGGDGRSDGRNGEPKNGCCVEATAERLFYRDPVSFPDNIQPWVWAQSKKDGILGLHMRRAFNMA